MFSAFKGADLRHRVGIAGEGSTWKSDGTEGALCYGPYIALPAGIFTVAFRISNRGTGDEAARINVEVVSNGGNVEIARGRFQAADILSVPTRLHIDFVLSEAVSDLEVRIHVWAKTMVTLFDLTIYDRDS